MRSRRSSTLAVRATAGDGVALVAALAPVPMLVDLPTLVDGAGQSMDVCSLVDLVRRAAPPGCDLRVLAPEAYRCREVLQEVADALGCDIYLAGRDVDIVQVGGAAVAVARATRDPVDWLVVRPAGLPISASAWFEQSDGVIRARTGLVTLPLQGGLAFATRETFAEMAKFVNAITSPTAGVTALAAPARDGQFAIGWYAGYGAVLNGADFARLVTANLDDVRSDVQIALTWPTGPNESRLLDAELRRAADALDRTVWVPELGGGAACGTGIGGPIAVDFDGRPARWVAYASARRVASPRAYATDDLGRLVPAQPVSREELDIAGQPAGWPVAPGRPTLQAISRGHPPHHIAWLPSIPLTNADRVELYVWTTLPPDCMPAHGLSIPDGFVLAHLDGRRLAAEVRSGFLVRVEVAAGTAVALPGYFGNLPASLQHCVRESSDTFLLPATWLARVKIIGCHEVDNGGKFGPAVHPEQPRLTVAFRGADHGVEGLPNSALRWPARRKPASAFLLLPDDPEWIRARLAAFPGWLPLARQRPNRAAAYRAFEVEVPGRSVLDVAATLAAYADAPLAGSSLAAFAGVDLLLPARAFRKALIVKDHQAGHRDWRTAHHMEGRSLAEVLPPGSWDETASHPTCPPQ
jgi:hypothetical protein